jgi:hypothetical protein
MEHTMTIKEINVGDRLLSDPLPVEFEVLKVNRVTVRVRNTKNGNVLSVYPELFTRKAD